MGCVSQSWESQSEFGASDRVSPRPCCRASRGERRRRKRGATYIRESSCGSLPDYAINLGASGSLPLSKSIVPIHLKARELPPHVQLDTDYGILSSKMQSEKVSDVMTSRGIQAIGPHATVGEAAKKMNQVQKGCLLVVEGARPVGILTEWDLIHKVVAKNLPLDELEVSKVMTKDLICIPPEAPVSEAAKLIVKHGVHRLVVMDDGNVVGLLPTTDLAGILVR